MRLDTINANELIENCKLDFEATAIEVFRYQYDNNELYYEYNQLLKVKKDKVDTILKIPFLPISFFKSHQILTRVSGRGCSVFESSGTSGMQVSRHYVKDLSLYNEVSISGFEQYYGSLKDWVILALLPSYLERSTSSLVQMAKQMMNISQHPSNGFYLNNFEVLSENLMNLKFQGKKVLLLGVTFALLDFAELYPIDLSFVTVMETGGMKGRRQEWTREQVHDFLCKKWNLQNVHSEYGMTELLSQSYAQQDGFFRPIITKKLLVRDMTDPLETLGKGSGVLNVIDLANIHSCSFIATEDLGQLYADGAFEVLGRVDFAALRGCSLLAL